MQNISDHILINKIQEGNKTAFDQLFFKYYKPLYRFALNYCHNSLVAEESVQRTFIKIWQNNSHTNYSDDIGKLLFTYTKNEIIDELRKVNTRKKYEEIVYAESCFEPKQTNHDDKCRIQAIIESAIEQLPRKSKEIFRLAKQEGLSNTEIADYLKLSKKTVENQLSSAYKKLRIYLEPFKNQLEY